MLRRRTLIWLLVITLLVWFAIVNPATAGHAVSAIARGLSAFMSSL